MKTSLRARLSLWMIAVVAGALALAGLGAILLQDRATITSEESRLIAQARTIATSLSQLRQANLLPAVTRIAGITGVTLIPYDTAGKILTGEAIGPTTVTLPQGIRAATFPPVQVANGGSFSGRAGNTLYAAVVSTDNTLFTTCAQGYLYNPHLQLCVYQGLTLRQLHSLQLSGSTGTSANVPPVQPPGNACGTDPCAGALVLVTNPVDISQGIIGYFLLASAIALLLAVAIALTIAHRITRPLRHAVETTRKIASGDLDVQVASRPDDYPEMSSLATSLNRMGAELREARDMQRNFLLSVSHDLRTPLTSIRGYAEAISDGTIDEPARAAEVISAESRRLERLVADLLDLAKLSAHTFSFSPARVDVGEIVAATAEAFRPTLEGEGISLDTRVLTDSDLSVVLDGDRLAQVLSNLLENAYKYARSAVRVVAGFREGWIVVGIEDDGPGIPAADLPHIFDRLFTANRVAARRVGTGLGLAIVAELLQTMGATVRADSPVGPDGGTRMVVTLRPAGPLSVPLTTPPAPPNPHQDGHLPPDVPAAHAPPPAPTPLSMR